MNLANVKIYFRQFGFLHSLKFLISGFFQRVLDPHRIASYSQGAEDRIIRSILGNTQNGYYVDVGCNDPQRFSNTFALYRQGWSGINIDANQYLIGKHRRLKKRDISVCAVVSDKEQEVIFTEFNDSLVSSIDAKQVDKWKGRREIKRQTKLKTVSLNEILEEYNAPKFFDLLSIDVEGHDFEVLCSIDLATYRPKLIVVEMHGLDISELPKSTIYQYLASHNYGLVGYIRPNSYFVDKLCRKQDN
jgi:FkbM family methyltransferase